jgi:predicted GNAT family N-acyltransferase
MSVGRFAVRVAQWDADAAAIAVLRRAVFVAELGVPAELERDGRDPVCSHVVASDASGTTIGCGRLLPDGSIGRIAVAAGWRRRGVGGAIVERLVEVARASGHRSVALSAQSNACAFYERHGFVAAGERWTEGGLEHVRMERPLEKIGAVGSIVQGRRPGPRRAARNGV